MWLRLVQSARDKEEQNLEAYIKNGQLFYRSLRRIAKDEELLVWYGKELTELLLLCPSRSHTKMNGRSAVGPFASQEESFGDQRGAPVLAGGKLLTWSPSWVQIGVEPSGGPLGLTSFSQQGWLSGGGSSGPVGLG